jgi:hypothetical protein
MLKPTEWDRTCRAFRSIQPGTAEWIEGAHQDVTLLISTLAALPCGSGPSDASLKPLQELAQRLASLREPVEDTTARATGNKPGLSADMQEGPTSDNASAMAVEAKQAHGAETQLPPEQNGTPGSAQSGHGTNSVVEPELESADEWDPSAQQHAC